MKCIVIPKTTTCYFCKERDDDIPHYYVSKDNAELLQMCAVTFEDILHELNLTPADWGEIIELAEEDEHAQKDIQRVNEYIAENFEVIKLEIAEQLPPNSPVPAGWVEVEKRKYYLRKGIVGREE